jgi:hypothetical protein
MRRGGTVNATGRCVGALVKTLPVADSDSAERVMPNFIAPRTVALTATCI